jgi:tetratricopeptide (TPR) repeat protein
MAPTRFQSGPDEEFERVLAQSNRGKLLVLIIGGLTLGGGIGWYFGIRVPEQQQVEVVAAPAPEAAPGELDAGEAVSDGGEAALDAGDVGDARDAGALTGDRDAGVPVVPAEVDAGVEAIDAGPLDGSATGARPAAKRSFELLMAQAERLRQREKPEAALDLYGTAHELKPARVEPLVGRGLALLDLGNPPAAVSAFEQALKLNARHGPALMGLAEALRLGGNKERAVEYYRQYLEVLPNGVDAAVARNNIERLKK